MPFVDISAMTQGDDNSSPAVTGTNPPSGSQQTNGLKTNSDGGSSAQGQTQATTTPQVQQQPDGVKQYAGPAFAANSDPQVKTSSQGASGATDGQAQQSSPTIVPTDTSDSGQVTQQQTVSTADSQQIQQAQQLADTGKAIDKPLAKQPTTDEGKKSNVEGPQTEQTKAVPTEDVVKESVQDDQSEKGQDSADGLPDMLLGTTEQEQQSQPESGSADNEKKEQSQADKPKQDESDVELQSSSDTVEILSEANQSSRNQDGEDTTLPDMSPNQVVSGAGSSKLTPFGNDKANQQAEADKSTDETQLDTGKLSEQQGEIKHLDDYLRMGMEQGASDVHFTVGYRVALRVSGALQPLQSPLLDQKHMERFVDHLVKYKGLQMPKRHQQDELKDLDMAYEIENEGRFRVNISMARGKYNIVCRLIPNEIKTVDQLQLPQILLEFSKLPFGLVLVTGPTGSGKSTTLSAMINHINQTDDRHIITIEDPIEYVYPPAQALVTQREMSRDTSSWENALRSVLRQDPDVVLVGEMRDYETISSALHVAETGHLVFATLHTNNAAQTMDRIIDVFPPHQQSQVRTQLASSLQAVISQRLIPTSDGKDRRAAIEILVANDAVRSSIREGKVHQINNIIQTGADVGMMTMEKSLVNLVREGAVTMETAQEYTDRPEEILSLLRRS